MPLSRTTRFALRLGLKTREYHQWEAVKAHQIHTEKRKAQFLNSPRERVLKDFPETKGVYEVYDSALRFFSDVLMATPTSLATNRRNTLRAQALALGAFDYLDNHQEIPPFTREGRHEEATMVRVEELRTLRVELNQSFEDNARINPATAKDAETRYAQFSIAFF
ncbi:hypothetical protein [Legionella feeleii]|uniref:Uncharacterized protein n=1 Tax=Legionella feeleii TaxID=453 RepID=A0A378IVM9_9GAMM|nr:hypothetical protein [Legionella feeleii]STX39288.1 Uncharacterised protein [Legionella feeleii]